MQLISREVKEVKYSLKILARFGLLGHMRIKMWMRNVLYESYPSLHKTEKCTINSHTRSQQQESLNQEQNHPGYFFKREEESACMYVCVCVLWGAFL